MTHIIMFTTLQLVPLLLVLLLLVPQVRAVFEQLQEPDWLVQDASQPIEQIHRQVRAFRGSLQQPGLTCMLTCQHGSPGSVVPLSLNCSLSA
jgi:hypothetical protein